MRRSRFAFVAAAVGAVLAPTCAISADLPVKAPSAIVAHDWSGVYVGANLGWGFSNAHWQNLNDTALFGDATPGDTFSNRVSGITGGAQLGINFQSGPWVFGF